MINWNVLISNNNFLIQFWFFHFNFLFLSSQSCVKAIVTAPSAISLNFVSRNTHIDHLVQNCKHRKSKYLWIVCINFCTNSSSILHQLCINSAITFIFATVSMSIVANCISFLHQLLQISLTFCINCCNSLCNFQYNCKKF